MYTASEDPFADLNSSNAAYCVEEFRLKYRHFPVMMVKSSTRLPVRYKSKTGELAYRMSDIFRLDHRLQVLGFEPGKSVDAVGTPVLNILLRHPSARADVIVLTPKDFFMKLRPDPESYFINDESWTLADPDKPEAAEEKPAPIKREAWVKL
jgi:hypothetical protein